jgi:hypothetical protein
MPEVRKRRGRRRAAAVTIAAMAGLSGCGSSSSSTPPPAVNPTQMALEAPGVRTVLVPQQRSAITVVVPPCSDAGGIGNTPPTSNQIVLPKGTAAQTVAIQPCIVGQTGESRAGTVVLTPGGGETAQEQSQQQTSAQTQNQLVIPSNSGLTRNVIQPCVVSTTASSSVEGTTGPNALAVPARGKRTVTAPPCEVSASSSSG